MLELNNSKWTVQSQKKNVFYTVKKRLENCNCQSNQQEISCAGFFDHMFFFNSEDKEKNCK